MFGGVFEILIQIGCPHCGGRKYKEKWPKGK